MILHYYVKYLVSILKFSGSSLGDSSQYSSSHYPVNQNSVYDANYDYGGYQSGEVLLLSDQIKEYHQGWTRSPNCPYSGLMMMMMRMMTRERRSKDDGKRESHHLV